MGKLERKMRMEKDEAKGNDDQMKEEAGWLMSIDETAVTTASIRG